VEVEDPHASRTRRRGLRAAELTTMPRRRCREDLEAVARPSRTIHPLQAESWEEEEEAWREEAGLGNRHPMWLVDPCAFSVFGVCLLRLLRLRLRLRQIMG